MLNNVILKKNSWARYLSGMSVSRSWQWKSFGGRFSTKIHKGGSTIYALSSGQGKCGVAVVRISGCQSLEALKKMTSLETPKPKTVFLRKIYNPETGELIDKGLCIWFPGPNSFTGEDTVEFQVHGGSAVLSALMSALSKLQFRPAEPGEFTRRSFYNNKLDLTEIEGLADLIHAETEQQRKQALLQADGSLSELYNNWRITLSYCLAHLEAYIDFSEEEDIEENLLQKCDTNLIDLSKKIEDHLADGRRGEILRSGVRTVIVGKPNVGKSSLLNTLVQRNAAIVTSVAGTTRDIVELMSNISGYSVILADTAGLSNNSQDFIEQEGIRRARLHAEKADFIILVADAFEFQNSGHSYEEYIQEYIKSLELAELLKNKNSSKKYIVVMNKTDLINEKTKKYFKSANVASLSCENKEGLQDLLDDVTKYLMEICGNPSRENPTISQTRHRIHLTSCLIHINTYFEIKSRDKYDVVIATEKIREAMKEVGKITGHVSTEQILDIIFKDFCIGK